MGMLKLGTYKHNKTGGIYNVLGLVYVLGECEFVDKYITNSLLVINATSDKNEIIYKDKTLDIYYLNDNMSMEKVYYLYENKKGNLFIRGIKEFHEDVLLNLDNEEQELPRFQML